MEKQTNKQTNKHKNNKKIYLSRYTCYITVVSGASWSICPSVTGVLYLEDGAVCMGDGLKTVLSNLFIHVCVVELAHWIELICTGERLLLEATLLSPFMWVCIVETLAMLPDRFMRVCIVETAYETEYLVTRLRLETVFWCLADNILGTKRNILQRNEIKI